MRKEKEECRMKRKKLRIVCVLFLFLCPIIGDAKEIYTYLETENINELTNIKANHILLINRNDNKILYEKNSEQEIAIASLTKIMTALVTILQTENLDETIQLTEEAFLGIDGYMEAGFKIGESVTIRDLLYGTLLPSGVEASQALALHTSGSIENFVSSMNHLANILEMNHTHFSNPVGRDADNHSTLEDLSKLLLFALQNDTFYEIYTTKEYTTTNGLNLKSTLFSASSKYNLDTKFIKGSKSGYTKKAGLCLSSIAEKNGTEFLLLVADSLYENGFPNHVIDSMTIYQYFFNNYSYQEILKQNQELSTFSILDGKENNLTIKSEENISLYLKNDMAEKLEYEFVGRNTIDKKVNYGDHLGNVVVKYNQKTLYTYPIYLKENITYLHTKEILLLFSSLAIFFLFLFMLKWKKEKEREICKNT